MRYKLTPVSPLDLATQFVSKSSTGNDLIRLGLRVRATSICPIVKNFFHGLLNYSISFYPIQLDAITGFNWQMEHVYTLSILKNRLILSGFLDHNVLKAGSKVISEHQVALRTIDQLYIVSEYRHNDFLGDDKNGFGFGLEYKILFPGVE